MRETVCTIGSWETWGNGDLVVSSETKIGLEHFPEDVLTTTIVYSLSYDGN